MALQNYVTQLHQDWNGNGQIGWKARISKFMDGFEAIEKEREKAQQLRHHENAEKIDKLANRTQTMILIVGVVSVLLVALGIILGTIEAKRAGLIPFNIFGPQNKSLVLSSNQPPQDAGNPY